MLAADGDLVGNRQDVIERGLADAQHRGGARHGATAGIHDATVADEPEPAPGANGPLLPHVDRIVQHELLARLVRRIYSR
jgi:hypothetical protein